jgi:DNA-binding GntR family transcriptional regulator
MAQVYQMPKPLSDRQSSPQLIADALREAIICGRLAPGEPLRQESLATHFSASRIPLREALRSLESEGWIEFLPNRGARVAGLSASEVAEIYEIRASLECTALRLALPAHTPDSWRAVESALRAAQREAQRARYVQRNREFHFSLYAPANRPHLTRLIDSLHSRGERYLRLKLDMPSHKSHSDDEHEALYGACRRGDVDGACAILEVHLLQTGALLATYLENAAQASAPTKSVRSGR